MTQKFLIELQNVEDKIPWTELQIREILLLVMDSETISVSEIVDRNIKNIDIKVTEKGIFIKELHDNTQFNELLIPWSLYTLIKKVLKECGEDIKQDNNL